jgi:hypothetical protein
VKDVDADGPTLSTCEGCSDRAAPADGGAAVDERGPARSIAQARQLGHVVVVGAGTRPTMRSASSHMPETMTFDTTSPLLGKACETMPLMSGSDRSSTTT